MATPLANNIEGGEASKTSGQFHSVKGTVVETIGEVTGATSWTEAGRKEHNDGEAEYKAAEAQKYVEGAADRMGGTKDKIVGALEGNKQKQAEGDMRHDKGATQQKLNS